MPDVSSVPVTANPDRYRCLCCGYWTMSEPTPGSLDLCPVCFWQDCSQGAEDPSTAIGPNAVSLATARSNYKAFGAMERRFVAHVRPPTVSE